MGLGLVLRRLISIDVRPLSRVTLYVLSPCLIFSTLSQSTLEADDLGRIVAFTLATTFAMGVISWGATRLLRFDQGKESAFLLATLFVNAGNYGLPLNLLAFGEEGLAQAIVFFATSSFLVNTLAVYLASRGQVGGRESMANIFKIPLIYAVVAALIVNFGNLEIPEAIFKPLEMTGSAAIPVMLLILGMELSQASVREEWGTIGVATLIRLVVAAGVALWIAPLLGLAGVTRQACIVEASMPTAVMTTILAVEFDARPKFVTGTVFTTTLASIVTLTLLLRLLR